MALLELERLTVAYGRLVAVREISMHVEEGELVGVIGRNGVGKSTTLLAVAGVLKPVSGTIRFDGRSLVGRAPEDVLRDGVSLVPESRHIFSRLTVGENLQIGATIRRDRAAARADVERMVERFPVLGRYRDQSAGTLSGGEQQQLAIARALVSRPRLLLLDEPSLGLSPVMVDEVFRVIAELREQGVTVLLVEQNAARTVEVADRTYVLASGGRIALQGRAEELLAHEDLARSYLGVEVTEA